MSKLIKLKLWLISLFKKDKNLLPKNERIKVYIYLLERLRDSYLSLSYEGYCSHLHCICSQTNSSYCFCDIQNLSELYNKFTDKQKSVIEKGGSLDDNIGEYITLGYIFPLTKNGNKQRIKLIKEVLDELKVKY